MEVIKKFILMMFVMILLFGSVSAWEWDNIKSVDYKELSLNYPTITLKNSLLWIIPLDPIVDIALTKHTAKCINGKCNSEQSFNSYYEISPVEDIMFESFL